jgi:hypothetical protein
MVPVESIEVNQRVAADSWVSIEKLGQVLEAAEKDDPESNTRVSESPTKVHMHR